MNKKKIIFQIEPPFNIKCEALEKKFNFIPKNNFELFKFIKNLIEDKFMDGYDSYIKSSCIKSVILTFLLV